MSGVCVWGKGIIVAACTCYGVSVSFHYQNTCFRKSLLNGQRLVRGGGGGGGGGGVIA